MGLQQKHTFSRRHFCLCCMTGAAFAATGGWLTPRQAFAEARGLVTLIKDSAAASPVTAYKLRENVTVLEEISACDVSAFGESFKFKRLNQQLFGDDVKHAVKAKFVSVFILVDVAIPAAAVWFKCFKDHLVAARSQPLDVQIRIGVRPEDQFTRRIELARDEHFLYARLGCNRRFIF